MKNVKAIFTVSAIFMLLAVSCSKEQKSLNKMKGRWKVTERLLVNEPGATPIPGSNIYLTFDACKPHEDCLVLMENFDDDGTLLTSETMTYRMEDEKSFDWNGGVRFIVSLTETDFVFTSGQDLYMMRYTLVKQ